MTDDASSGPSGPMIAIGPTGPTGATGPQGEPGGLGGFTGTMHPISGVVITVNGGLITGFTDV